LRARGGKILQGALGGRGGLRERRGGGRANFGRVLESRNTLVKRGGGLKEAKGAGGTIQVSVPRKAGPKRATKGGAVDRKGRKTKVTKKEPLVTWLLLGESEKKTKLRTKKLEDAKGFSAS